MSVAQFVQTNFNVQDSVTYKTSIDADISVMARIAAMFAPHQTATPAMTITIDAGALFVSNALVVKTAQTSGTITAPASNPRIDRAVIDSSTGVLSIITGAEDGSPSPPAITSGKLPVAQIYLIVGQSTIINANITDERIPSGSASGGLPSLTGNADKKLFVKHDESASEWVSGFKVGTFTYDISTASGTQAVTGVGFKPSIVVFIGTVTGTVTTSHGFDNGANAYAQYMNAFTATWEMSTSQSLVIYRAGSDASGHITTMGTDGFTITWTKTGSPTGTAIIAYMALR
jgi:hypothetical protein